MKMQTIGGKHLVFDRERILKFDNLYDAWLYVIICREIRDKVATGERSLYPVRSLNPIPERIKKNVVFV